MESNSVRGLVVLLVGGMVLAELSGCRPESVSPPVVSVTGSEAVCNLGDVAPGSEHAVVFSIENPRDTAVQILKIRTDCACTTLVEQPKQIDPRGSARVTLRFQAPPTLMAYESRLLVQTDDPQRKLIWLVIKSRTVK
jgi:hypothetical protein